MTIKIKKQKSKDKKYQVVYVVKNGKEIYIGTEKKLLEWKAREDVDKGKRSILSLP